MKIKRNSFLEYIRGISCLLIILYHYTTRYDELYGAPLSWKFSLPWGYMAVATFYLLSGYLSVVKNEKQDSITKYFVKKVTRLFPSYWVAITITFIVTTLWLKDRAVSFKAFLINFTMLESFVGVALVDGAYWTLANELIFYVFIGVTVIVMNQYKRLPLFLLIWQILLFIYQFLPHDKLIVQGVGKIMANPYGHMFIAGCSIHFLTSNCGKSNFALSCVNIVLAFAFQYWLFGTGYFIFFIVNWFVILFAVYVNNADVRIPNKVQIMLQPIKYIAEVSYPLYLLHQNIGYVIITSISRYYESEIIIIIPILFCILLSALIHEIVEKKVGKLRYIYG